MDKSKLNYPVPYDETWDISDSTKVQTFMNCPRRYFYEYVLGWRLEGGNLHLVFGKAIHEAMEILMYDLSPQAQSNAIDIFMTIYRGEFPDESTDSDRGVKTPIKGLEAITGYAAKYNSIDSFDSVRTEIAGTVPINDEDFLTFRIDAIIRDKDGVWLMDHKTTSRVSQVWMDQWSMSFQLGTYSHVLYSLHEADEVWGAKINGIALYKKGVEFLRVPVKKSPEMMQSWLFNANHWMDMINKEFSRLSQSTDSHSVLEAFPQNTGSCGSYGGCPYLDFCMAWPNPLRRADAIPFGFKQEFWNPKTHNEEGAKEVVKI